MVKLVEINNIKVWTKKGMGMWHSKVRPTGQWPHAGNGKIFPEWFMNTKVNNNRITNWIQIILLCGSSVKFNERRDKVSFIFQGKSNLYS